MSFYVVDVESDGQIPGRNSMVCFGAVRLDNELQTTFYGKTRPVSPEYNEETLAISGFSRKGHESFDDPKAAFENFAQWLTKNNLKGRPILISDNNGYDAAWINCPPLKRREPSWGAVVLEQCNSTPRCLR